MIITLVGTNTFLVQLELKKLTSDFVGKYGDISLERLDGEETTYEKLSESLQSLPFLSERKLVVVKNPAANKQFSEKFEQLLETIPQTTDVVLIEPKPDKRTVFYKTLQKHTDFRDFPELYAQEMPKWLVSQVSLQGATLKMEDAAYLVQRIGPKQQLLSKELEKLLLYKSTINRETID